MTTPQTTSPAHHQPPMYQVVPLAELHSCPLNPRKRFNEIRIAELARSMAPPVGILEPLVVRPMKKNGYEIVNGERRFRAAKLAGLEAAPILIRHLSDAEALGIMVIENNQREDVHPLEECNGYRDLMKLDPLCTVAEIAARTGKDESYIYRRIKLHELIPAARKAFEKDELTVSHAERLARLTKEQQAEALGEACFYPLFGVPEDAPAQALGYQPRRSDFADDEGPGRRDVMPVSKLDEWIAKHTRVELESPDTPHYFPELAAPPVPPGFEGGDEPGPKLLQLSDSHMPGADLGTKKHGALPRGRWVEIGAKDWTGRKVKPCEHQEQGVVVHGGPVRMLTVCATKGCKVHRPEKKKKAKGRAAGDEAARRARDQARFDEQQRQGSIRHAFGELLQDAIGEKAAGVKKLDARTSPIAARFFRVKRVKTADLPGLVIMAAAEDLGTYHVEDLSKIARALGIDPKPLQAKAEEKFPKKAATKTAKTGDVA